MREIHVGLAFHILQHGRFVFRIDDDQLIVHH